MRASATERLVVEENHILIVPPAGEVVVPDFLAMDGAAAPVKTSSRVRSTDAHLIVTFDCVDDSIQVDPKHTRDHADLWKDDCVEVFIDVDHRHEKGRGIIHVVVNAAGVVGDDIDEDPQKDLDGLAADVKQVPGGWKASIRIPWKALGGRPPEGATWGFNLGRSDYPKAAYMCFSPTYRGFWQMQHWGHLVFTNAGKIPENTRKRMIAEHDRALIRLKEQRNPFYSVLHGDLAALAKVMPGASTTCVWTADGERHDLPALTGDGPSAPVKLPNRSVAVGAVWPIAHVADRVKLVFVNMPPQGDDLSLQVFDGRRWVVWNDGLETRVEGNAVEISFEPVAAEKLRVMLAPGAGVARIEIHRYLAEAQEVTWPRRVVTRELTRRMLARDEEPSFEALKLHGLSMPAWAMTGLKDTGHEQAVYWDGQIHCHGRRIRLLVGESRTPLGRYRDTIRRSLMEGWMPAVTVTARVGQLAISQTSFSAYTDATRQTGPAMFVQVKVRNAGKALFDGPLSIRVTDAPKDPFEGTLGVDIFRPPVDRSRSRWRLKDGVLTRNGSVFLVSSRTCRAGARAGEVVFDLKLAPGADTVIRYAVPSPAWKPSQSDAAKLARFPQAKALENFKAYWQELLKPAMKLDLPEERLELLHKAVLTQIFISGYGDILPYGAAPSSYDGCTYGGEEAYPMYALAMSGFGPDAQRYMDFSYLQPKRIEKADAGNAILRGLRATYAVEMYRLTRDRRWIAKHLDLLKAYADRTLASRRKTMHLENGVKPLHYGLLPPCPSGGDFSRVGYALFPNFACWRGLKDTAWLLERFGQSETAKKYQAEAEDYHKTLLHVVDSILRKDVSPPFLPELLGDTEPKHGDYYQLMAHFIVSLWPFELSDRRANYISDFIEADNRTFCMLPRFRTDGNPQGRDLGAGGIDAIYSLGGLLQNLQQNRIREFLLGFYAFQVFNMEHTCFTSREGNRVYSSDLHLRTPSALSDWSDPLTCSSAVGWLLLRHLLVTEEALGAGQYSGKLLLLYSAPRRWFEPGKKIVVDNAVTHAGKVSFKVAAAANGRSIRADITLPRDSTCPAVKIRLRHPQGRPMRSVTIDGKRAASFDARDELVEIPSPAGTVRVVAEY